MASEDESSDWRSKPSQPHTQRSEEERRQKRVVANNGGVGSNSIGAAEVTMRALSKTGPIWTVTSTTSGVEGRKHLWSALKKLRDEGKAKVIGVSNYGVKHLKELVEAGGVPAINQIEIHPWCQQRPIVDYCRQRGIVLQAYCPIVRGAYASDPLLDELAQKYNVSWAQVLLRWSLQKGYSPLPKSDTPSRIVSNADLYGRQLDEADVARLDQCDKSAAGAVGPNPVEVDEPRDRRLYPRPCIHYGIQCSDLSCILVRKRSPSLACAPDRSISRNSVAPVFALVMWVR
ncbi:hypothetical protein ACQY0O_007916 [Thecaphora frezii]